MPVTLVQQRNLNMFNVKDYGAQGDGVTLDATAINACITASTNGSTIVFPGTTGTIYLVDATIQLRGYRTYIAAYGVVIKQQNSANLAAVLASYEWYNNVTSSGYPVKLFNLTVDGNSANNTVGHGIVLQNYDSIISECWTLNTPQSGIVNTSITQNGTNITNTAVENKIKDCKVNSAGQYGIWIHDTAGKHTDGYIQNCIVSQTTLDAIRVERGSGYFVHYNHVYGAKQSGIIVQNAWATSVIGNEIDGYGESTTASGFWSGIAVTCIGPRASIIADNLISSRYEINTATNYQYLAVTGGASTDARALVFGNHIFGSYVNTTSSSTTIAGSVAMTPANMDGIVAGVTLIVDTVGSGVQETVVVTSTTATTFTATFVNAHSGTNYPVKVTTATSFSQGIMIQTNGTQTGSGFNFYAVVYGNRAEQCGKAFYVDANSVTVLAAMETFGDVLVRGHIFSAAAANGAVPSVSAGLGAGTSPPTPTLSTADDTAGTCTFGTGTSPAAGTMVQINFATSFGIANPKAIMITPLNAITAALQLYVAFGGVTTGTGFKVSSNVAPAASVALVSGYSFMYTVIG